MICPDGGFWEGVAHGRKYGPRNPDEEIDPKVSEEASLGRDLGGCLHYFAKNLGWFILAFLVVRVFAGGEPLGSRKADPRGAYDPWYDHSRPRRGLMPISIPLAHRIDAEALVTALADAGVLSGTDDTVRLALGARLFADTSALATLACWGARHRAAGGTVEVDGDAGSLAYLSRMNVLDALGVARQEVGTRRVGDGRFIEVSALDEPDGLFTDAVCDLVLHHFDDAARFVPALEWAVHEVVDNVHIHAEAATPGFACAQYYPNRHRLEVSVVDLGRGLKASLSESHPVEDDEAAIRLALQRGVTRSRKVGQGNGLAGTRDIVEANGGSLSVWTGSCRWRLHRDGEHPPHEMPTWPGTGLRMSLDTRRPVDLETTFIEGTGWSYLDKIAEEVEEEGLSVAASCSFFGARPPAARLRRKVRALLDAMEPDESLVLDFEGVERASSSFLDELLGRLAEELGIETFRRRIRVRGTTDEVRRRANVVITQRVGEPVA